MSARGYLRICRGASMLSTRFTTGIGGLFVVTALLIVVQMYTGIQAFPL